MKKHCSTKAVLDTVWMNWLHTVFRCRTVVLRFAGGCVWLPLLDEHVAARLTQRLEEI